MYFSLTSRGLFGLMSGSILIVWFPADLQSICLVSSLVPFLLFGFLSVSSLFVWFFLVWFYFDGLVSCLINLVVWFLVLLHFGC